MLECPSSFLDGSLDIMNLDRLEINNTCGSLSQEPRNAEREREG